MAVRTGGVRIFENGEGGWEGGGGVGARGGE